MTIKQVCHGLFVMSFLTLLSLSLAGCGKKDSPVSPDESVRYPRQYPKPM